MTERVDYDDVDDDNSRPAKRARVEQRRAINQFERSAVERRRLHRMLEQKSRAPTESESVKLNALIQKVHPRRRNGQLFVGMHAVTLERASLEKIDLDGFFSLKADGLHALMARVNVNKAPMVRSKAAREEAEAARQKPPPDVPLGERYDTMLFVTRGGEPRAIDRVFVHHDRKHVVFDGELCLRKRRLSPDELWRINSAHNVHQSSYLTPYTYADSPELTLEQVLSDEHQKQYDHHYELVYAAFDCLLINTRQLAKSYLERMTLLHDLTETLLAQETHQPYKRSIEAIRSASHYAGGGDKFTLTVFQKPFLSVRNARAGLHAVPFAMRGIQTDGIIFNPNSGGYVPGFNDRLLKFKLVHTVDFTIGRRGAEFVLSVQERGKPVVVSRRLLIDNECAEQLLLAHADGKAVLECEAVLQPVGEQPCPPDQRLAWRPVLHRREKTMPNSVRNYQNIVRAVLDELDEEAVIMHVEQRIRVERATKLAEEASKAKK